VGVANKVEEEKKKRECQKVKERRKMTPAVILIDFLCHAFFVC
jgi:hypothetical protein